MSVGSSLRDLNVSGKKFRVFAYENNGQCEFEKFLADLKNTDKNKFEKLIKRIAWVADDGPPNNNPAQCCLADKNRSDNLYVFVIGGIRVFWFVNNKRMILCSCIEIIEGNNLSDQDIENALSIKSNIEVLRYANFRK